MLHEVAGSDVSVTDIVQPLRKMLRHTQVLIGDVEEIDLVNKHVRVVHAESAHTYDLIYDQLVLALGAVTNFYRTPGLEEHAMTMKTLGDAILLRNRLIDALDMADNAKTRASGKAFLTVVVVGAGFAGVETVGAVNDLLREAMKFYPNVNEGMLRVVVVHDGEVLLPELSESLGRYTQRQLELRGIQVRLKTKVTDTTAKRRH
jgi:NADH dehydrogenase